MAPLGEEPVSTGDGGTQLTQLCRDPVNTLVWVQLDSEFQVRAFSMLLESIEELCLWVTSKTWLLV